MVTTLTVKRMYRLKRGKIHQQGDYNIAGPAPLSAFWNSTNSPCPLSNGVLTPAASPSRLSWSCCTSWSVGEITKVCNLSTDCVQTSDWMVSPWPFYKNRSQQKPPKHPLRHSFTFYVCVCFSLFVCFISLFAFSFDVTWSSLSPPLVDTLFARYFPDYLREGSTSDSEILILENGKPHFECTRTCTFELKGINIGASERHATVLTTS